ncbi:hypothetical protein Tco_0485743, partial [Tanacetum coccineum]
MKETKGKKVVTSLDFQEEVSTGEGVNTTEGVNTSSIKVSTVSKQVSTDSINKSIPSPDKGQREGKAHMINKRKETKGKKVVTSLDFQEKVSTAEGVNTDSIKVSIVSKQVSTDSINKS